MLQGSTTAGNSTVPFDRSAADICGCKILTMDHMCFNKGIPMHYCLAEKCMMRLDRWAVNALDCHLVSTIVIGRK